MNQNSGPGPLGTSVEFNEFSADLQKSTPQVLASGSGSIIITGNGTTQNVFSDTLSDTEDGDIIKVHIYWYAPNINAGSVIAKVGTTTLGTTTHGGGGSPDACIYDATFSRNASAGGYYHVIKLEDNASVSHSTQKTNPAALTSISLTCNPAGGTNPIFGYAYSVIRYKKGV